MTLDVVFASCDLIDRHLFCKALRWAEQNVDDRVVWIRNEAFRSIPQIDIDWSSKINELKRIHFVYADCIRRTLLGCVKYIQSECEDLASMIVSCPDDVDSITFGSILAHLKNMSSRNDCRLVVTVNMNLNTELLNRLQMISSMFADRILIFNGLEFDNLLDRP